MDHGSYGLCKVCHESIERPRLLSNPLAEYCLDHLTGIERQALQDDLNLASHVQAALLPRRVASDVWDVHYHYEPAGAVSGDYCDLIEGAGGDLFFLFGDVAGKGIAASMLTAHLHAMYRALIAAGLPIEQLLTSSNRLFSESTMPAAYATLVCGRASRSGEIKIANAGHCPPMVIRSGSTVTIEATGLPLGLFPTAVYSVESLRLELGESLLLYTDGISEARDGSGVEYGTSRLSGVVGGVSTRSAEGMTKACVEDVKRFCAGAPKADDLTVMVIRRADIARM
jgi:sigma-B regulation protein RsbU (phosphoserine phosphatase)